MEKRPADIIKTSRKDVRRVKSSRRPQYVNFVPLVQMHFHCIIFNFISPDVCLKQRVGSFIVLEVWRNGLKTPYKDPKVTPGRWRSRDVPGRTKRNFCGNVFSFSSPKCVLHIKKLVIAYSFSFGETSYERPKNVPKWHLPRDVLGTSQVVNLNIFHKIGFREIFL